MIAAGQMVTLGMRSRAGIRTVLRAPVVHICQLLPFGALDVAIIYIYLHGENTF